MSELKPMPQEPAGEGWSCGTPCLRRIPELPMLTASGSHPGFTALPATHATWRRQRRLRDQGKDGWMDRWMDGWMEVP